MTLNISPHYILISLISNETSSAQLIEKLFYMMSHFSLFTFKILTLDFGSLIIMYVGVGFFKCHLPSRPLSFLYM